MENLEGAILELVNAPGYRPVKPRLIAQQLKLPKDDAVLVRRAVKRLVRLGRLNYGANHLVAPIAAETTPPKKKSGRSRVEAAGNEARTPTLASRPRRESGKKAASQRDGNRVVGVFQRTQKGFGFVRLDQPGASREVRDIYIAADRTRDASTGDIVAVQLYKPHFGEPGPSGEIVEIVERQSHEFVGTYFESAGAAYVRVDGTLFARPIYVGDPGAKNAQPDDKVVIEMLRFPSAMRDGEGVILEVLGPRSKPGVDTLSIIREFNLPDAFAADALEEAHREADAFDEQVGERTDFTAETILTIDPVDARDFDDAISLERLENGHWRLGVHIADVSHFVRPGTALDREAQERATSVYLPDRVLPMLPEVISNGLASLQPGKVRYTKSAVMEFTAEGVRVSTELHSAAIRSSKRLTYEQVDEFLLDRESARRKLGGKACDLLARMHALAMTLRRRRMTRGALVLSMPEVKVELDKHGRVVGAHVTQDTESHQMIEEFMLAANEAVAETLAEQGLYFLRRVHPSPSPQKLQALTEFVAELGYATPSLESRFALQELLAVSAERPDRNAVHFAVLRSMQRAIYSPMKEGHYALASDCYCHFTSPIRRYPDLTVHRLVDAVLRKSKPRNNYDEMVVLARHCSDREQRAEAAERDLTKLKLMAYLSTRIGEEFDAVVTGVESYGLFVQGTKLPAEGLVRVETLGDDRYFFDRASHTLTGHRVGNSYRLGDLLRVAVSRVDLERREVDFRVVERKKVSVAAHRKRLAKARKGKPTKPAKASKPRGGLGGRNKKGRRKR